MLAALYFPVPARTFSHIRSAHRPLKAQLAGELAVAADEAEKTSIRAEFDARERILEHELDHTPRELALSLQVAYSKSLRRPPPPTCRRAHPSLPPPPDFLSK